MAFRVFDNVSNINVSIVIDVSIHSTAGPKCSGKRGKIYVTLLAIHWKLAAFKTVPAKTVSWNWVSDLKNMVWKFLVIRHFIVNHTIAEWTQTIVMLLQK